MAAFTGKLTKFDFCSLKVLSDERRHCFRLADAVDSSAFPPVSGNRQMKTPDTTEAESSVTQQGTQIVAEGRLPIKQNTVTADVLARLLAGQRLNGLDTVYKTSTTRLGAVVFCLANKYSWKIQSVVKTAGCSDGRVAWVSEYFMSAETISSAMAVGVGKWCIEVRAARNELRAHATQARRDASRANLASQAFQQHPAQKDFFEGVAA